MIFEACTSWPFQSRPRPGRVQNETTARPGMIAKYAIIGRLSEKRWIHKSSNFTWTDLPMKLPRPVTFSRSLAIPSELAY
jgi:hypothetical protein